MIIFKHGMAICVSVEGSSGVVCYNTKSISCATCQRGVSSCKHLTYVVDLLQTQPPPTTLKHWVVSSLPTGKQSSFISCKSTAAIPWKTTVAQQEIMKTSYKCRFQVENGIAYLYPKSQSRCSVCGAEGWSDPCMIRECLVITETVSFPAKGKCAYIFNAL